MKDKWLEIPYENEDMESVRQIALERLEKQPKEIFDEIEDKMTFNTYLGDTFAELTMTKEGWEELKKKFIKS